ncbi:peptidoglycan/xylan/chitin deacetylase (PgdA/CDA1 family) [Kineosphaera limosa]|uniref:Putative polysaccharide deacetylase n=1 Tax=Kineosphaera limosa NBRC 100340 TaxID=1184609 RepID=K6WN34_9MICO|nr:polysaccharide deacetylase family protein [Kineosphaera limosa]NYE01481.1 peptidoglycan/xylan/chitin deacetylase (PgdA/CDA1 family) [Kineosphaera limosa]GAB95226.1 putative polysaccharide deacetylase [Kineosphaera limosa NBRC 100340]
MCAPQERAHEGVPDVGTNTVRGAFERSDSPHRSPRLARRGFLAGGLAGLSGLALAACGVAADPASSGTQNGTGTTGSDGEGAGGGEQANSPTAQPTRGTAAEMVARATVPVLCYHQVRPWEAGDTSYNRSMLIIPPQNFGAQLDGMKAAGYTAISPAQYREHLFFGAQLPEKPVILSFDDGKDNQISQAMPALVQREMTGTFFIMTVILGSSGWMKRDDVKRLADAGMTVASHTWDHHMVTKYTQKDYATQLGEPRDLLRKLSGQEVDDFAYPYGAWNQAILPHIADAGYKCAYQLQEQPINAKHPEMTLRRILAVST